MSKGQKTETVSSLLRPEHPSTYFVQDRNNEDDRTRLEIQDSMITAAMGGVLPEQQDPTIFQRVLDVGCGTGGWLIEVAKTYPMLSLLVGVDISNQMVAYARAQAAAQQVNDRVEFSAMDALRRIEFPNAFFDLVNQRFGASYLRTWDWPKLLSECQRVTRPGGILRITEGDWYIESNSSALTQLFDLLLAAFSQAGHSFTLHRSGVTGELPHLCQLHGFLQVQSRLVTIEYRAGTLAWQPFFEDMKLTFRLIVPFLRKWTRVPDTYESLYQRALQEMQQPHFVARGSLVTVWGSSPF